MVKNYDNICKISCYKRGISINRNSFPWINLRYLKLNDEKPEVDVTGIFLVIFIILNYFLIIYLIMLWYLLGIII